MDQFAVVLEQYESPPPEKVSVLFQAICGLPKLDATQRATKVRGIVAERLPCDLAQKLQVALGNLKFPARVVPQQRLPEAIKGRRVQFVAVDPQHFGVRWSVTGQPRLYPWSHVITISAGVVYRESSEQVMRTVEVRGLMGGRLMTGRGVPNVTTEISRRDTSRDMAMALITLGASPNQLETLHLRAPEMDYASMLGEANVRPSPLQNFCLVLAKIGNLATQAEITEETIELITAANTTPRLPRSPRFESEDEFDFYQRWLVAKRLA